MLATLAAIIVAPNEAFATIRERPVWAWTVGLTIVLAMIGSLLATPAAKHMLEITLPAQFANDPHFAGLPPDQLAARTQRAMALAILVANFTWLMTVLYVPAAVLIEAAILFGVRTLLKSRATFAQLFALAAHVQFVALGIGSLVLGAVVALRPVESFRSQADFVGSVPSAAWLLPGAPPKITAFFATLGPFPIWSTILLAMGLVAVARLQTVAAWTTALLILLAGAAWAAAFIQ